jgi:hypothetical protein
MARVFIPFHVADGPAHASVALCYSRTPCTYCTYHPRRGLPYDELVDKPRDVEEVKRLAEQGEQYLNKKAISRLASSTGGL